MSQNSGLLSDELTDSFSLNSHVLPFYINALAAQDAPGPWTVVYNYIYQANAVIEGVQTISGITSPIRQQLEGEAKFIRAFWHFYLANCYGDVPIVTSTDYKTNSFIARSPKANVYKQIIADLQDAKNKLNSNYIDASDTAVTNDRVRPNKWAAASLLARVYLYTGNYSDAESQATEVINNTNLYSLVPELYNVFLANSNEAIWQLAIPIPNTANTLDAYNFVLLGAPINPDGATNIATISPQLLSSFELNDNRKTAWIGTYTTSGTPMITYYFPYKYKDISPNITEYVMVLRLAEQYLIRAEARAQQGKDPSEVVSDLNAIRVRAGLTDYTGAVDKTSLLAAILHERQVELFTEWGHRWFDLIRTGNADAVMSVVTPQKGGTWKSSWQLYPIPQSERMADFNLTQNPDY